MNIAWSGVTRPLERGKGMKIKNKLGRAAGIAVATAGIVGLNLPGTASAATAQPAALPVCTIQTFNGNYLTAVDGGGHTKDAVRRELQELLTQLGLPTLIVTHDYEDAAALAESVGVLVEGGLRQLGTPAELVSQPADPFVASFTGANLLRGSVQLVDDGLTRVRLETGEVVYSTDEAAGDVGVVVYPWDVSIGRVHADDSAMNLIRGEVTSISEVGNRVRIRVGPLTAEVTQASMERLGLARGGTAFASFKATGTRLVPLGARASALPRTPPGIDGRA